MICFFDINKLIGQPSDTFISLLRKHYDNIMRNNFSEAKALYGDSFLINPLPLFKNKADSLYIIQYIILASKRSYFLYKQYRIKYLDLTLYPDIDIASIKSNPLLKIENNKLHFIYEN